MTEEIELFVHAVFLQEAGAADAVKALLDAHFPPDKIGALMCDASSVTELDIVHKTGIARGAGLGAAIGVVGGALVTVSGLLLLGPAFLALEGALAGGALGTLAGTLGGLAYWNDEIEFPIDAFEKGAVLVGVSTESSRANVARDALLFSGADQVHFATKRQAGKAARADVLGLADTGRHSHGGGTL